MSRVEVVVRTILTAAKKKEEQKEGEVEVEVGELARKDFRKARPVTGVISAPGDTQGLKGQKGKVVFLFSLL